MYTHSEIPAAYAAKMQVHTTKEAPIQLSKEKTPTQASSTKKGGISPAVALLLFDLLS